jgi:hypothetical protein
VNGFAFAARRNSGRVRAGLAAFTANPWLSIATNATGRKSAVA